MIALAIRSLTFVTSIVLSTLVMSPVWAQNSAHDEAALVQALKNAKISLEDGLKSSEREGKPISAKFEIDEGKLQLSVYTMKGNGFSEVVVDPQSGAIAKAETITDPEDLEAAEKQKDAMAKATKSLRAAAQEAERANAGSRAVSITPTVKEGHPTAEIKLLAGGAIKTVTGKLD